MASFSSSIFIFSLFLIFSYIKPNHAALNVTEFIDQMLIGHNNARAAVHRDLEPLVWEPLLAKYARIYSDTYRRQDCKLIHSAGYGFGENLFWGQGHRWTGADAVKAWVDEKQWYTYANNSCPSDKICSHYTQIVWATTLRVGCSKIICDSGDSFIACEYYPPGNYVGAKPY